MVSAEGGKVTGERRVIPGGSYLVYFPPVLPLQHSDYTIGYRKHDPVIPRPYLPPWERFRHLLDPGCSRCNPGQFNNNPALDRSRQAVDILLTRGSDDKSHRDPRRNSSRVTTSPRRAASSASWSSVMNSGLNSFHTTSSLALPADLVLSLYLKKHGRARLKTTPLLARLLAEAFLERHGVTGLPER